MARHSAKHAKRSSRPIAVSWLSRIGVLAVVGVAVLLIVLGTYVVRSGLLGGSTRGAVSLQRVASRSSATSADTSATPVEIPTLVGLKVDEATMVLKAAGLTQVIRREAPGRSAEPTVSSQDPAPGALARAGSVVTLILPAASTAKSTVAKAKVRRGAFIVCIDPGHQSHTDSKTEPVGPGSAVRKPRITGGTTGALTGARECETVLQIGINLRRRLEAAGVTVVMTRTTNDVSLSNAERAQIASAAGANLFVRLHADSSTDASLSGVSTLFPSALGWTAPIAAPSKRAASAMQNALVKRTRAVDRGTAERSDLAGFNFSTVPAVLVAVGYPSNRVEDRLLVSPNYQDQVAQGLADGILGYLKSQR